MSNKILKVGTLFSGIGAFEHTLNQLNIPYEIVVPVLKEIIKSLKQYI